MEIISNSCFIKLVVAFLVIAFNCSVGTASDKQDTDLKKVASANNEFALNLYQNLASSNTKNLFFSPISIFIALGMLYDGASGETASELRKALGFEKIGFSDEDIDSTFNYLLTKVFTSTKDYTLTNANAILIDKRLNMRTEYKNKMQNYFNAQIEDVDFREESSKVKQIINNWVNSKTNGKIPRLVENLSRDTIIALLNAVYFKGTWVTPFKRSSTKPAEFYNYGQKSDAKMVPTMHMKSRILFASSPDWEIVELPYVGDNLSMMIILPDEKKNLQDLESNLSFQQIFEIRRKLRRTTVTLSLPKLRMESSFDLTKPLTSMGFQNIFKEADFSGMVEELKARVSKVEHKALVEVTEKGTEAAAVTGVFIVPMRASWPKTFKVNRPFLFTIIDTKSNSILFIGRVMSL
ncbi:serpin B4 [Trichonephila clavata]|uniref:Serpin B4 n=1 Tax=Trichonephila clavata TaxID=2740835 RepID=A0A8X6M321_TRICU|nr:serpin B4 [Trichonephila clavata]